MTPPGPEATERERLIFIETTVCGLHKRLYGNGQPGDIADIKNTIESRFHQITSTVNNFNHKMGFRVKNLERFSWMVAGGILVVGTLPWALQLVTLIKTVLTTPTPTHLP